jgi:hypothetical protein
MIVDLAVPALGEMPEFDRFADSQFGDHADVVSEQMNDYEEMLNVVCDDQLGTGAELRCFWVELTNDWRRGSWLEWCGGAAVNPPEEILRLRDEIAELQLHRSNLSVENTNLKAELEGLETELERKTSELESLTDAFRYLSEHGRCRLCGDALRW